MEFSKKICQFCGDEFTPTSGRQKFCTKPHERICPVCGSTYLETITNNLNRPPHACSPKCRGVLQKKTKAAKPKKKKLVEIECEKFDNYEINIALAQLKFKSEMCSKISKLLRRYNIKYMLFYHIDEFSYEFHLIEHKTLITLAQYGCDQYANKTKLDKAIKQGFRCIVVYPWDDVNKIMNMLKPKTVLNFSDCQIYRLNPQVSKDFLTTYHLQGSCRKQLIHLGLVHNKSLVQVMTFGKSRRSKKHYVEILRMCSHPDYYISNGYKKLFNYALTFYALDDIISYCDISKHYEIDYIECGLSYLRSTPPQEIWSKDNQYKTGNLLRSHGFDQLFETNYGKDVRNEKLMLEHGWLPIYDCGQHVFEHKN